MMLTTIKQNINKRKEEKMNKYYLLALGILVYAIFMLPTLIHIVERISK